MKFKSVFLVATLLSAIYCFSVNPLNAQNLENLLSSHIDVVVDSAGNGDFTTLTEAINAAPNNGSSEYVIFLRKGTYKEKVEISSSKINLTLVGENVDEVKITWDDYSGKDVDGVIIGTSTSHTLISDANNFKVINLTIENTAGEIAQAVALNFHGDRQQLLLSRLLGGQDTFYTWGAGRFYMKDSYIEGGTDFIFGRGAALFEDCLIVTNKSGGPVTANATDEGWLFGYVFTDCHFDAPSNISNVPLGRPWKEFCQVVIMNSYLDDHIRSAQWSEWSGNNNHETAYYALYNNSGPGYSPETALDWTHILTEEEAAPYTMQNIFASDVKKPTGFSSDWNPDLANDEVYNIVKNNVANLKEDTLYYTPAIESVSYDGEEIVEYVERYRRFIIKNVSYDAVYDPGKVEVTPLDSRATVEVDTEPVGGVFPGDVYFYITAPSGARLRYTIRFEPIPLKISESGSFSAYPNPVKDKITFLSSDFTNNHHVRLSIWDLAGNLKLSKQVKPQDGKITLETSDLKNGIYLYSIKTTNTQSITGKFIK